MIPSLAFGRYRARESPNRKSNRLRQRFSIGRQSPDRSIREIFSALTFFLCSPSTGGRIPGATVPGIAADGHDARLDNPRPRHLSLWHS
jgi:hypothetical protein